MLVVTHTSALAIGALLGAAAILWFQRDGLAPEAAVDHGVVAAGDNHTGPNSNSIEDAARQVGA